MIAIIDYGMGNLHSVKNALDFLKIESCITKDPEQIQQADKLILPGVGAFADCMKNLHETALYDVIQYEVTNKQKKILGICLGMQALYEYGEENGLNQGFGFVRGTIRKMEDTSVQIPHINWNLLQKNQEHEVFKKLSNKPYTYYVHSYYAQNYDEKDLIGYSIYGQMKISGLIQHENVMGCQFHPEKSGEDGLKILEYFGKEF